ARPDAAGEAVHCLVGFLGDTIEIVVVKAHGAQNRAENLFAYHRHVRPDVGQDRRLDEITVIADAVAAGDDGGAVAFALIDVARYALELFFGDERSHLRAVAQRVADADLFGF